MKTLTFYSYKGGVGRSLALVNIATRLAEFGKKVCIIDFDLEAPGLHLKLPIHPITLKRDYKGIVDFVYKFSNEGIFDENINNYITKVLINTGQHPISLIPAGNTENSEYWKKLSAINWYQLIYENPNGLAFFLKLKEIIAQKIKPDFLLIDSRTGISEMSGISLSLLADQVVIIAANNKENLNGAKKIILSLNNEENSILGKTPKINFVLSRIPFTDKPEDRAKENLLINRIKREYLPPHFQDINVIHSDRELEEVEKIKIAYEKDESNTQISIDYLKLFEVLTKDDLTANEIRRFKNIRLSERLVYQANNIRNPVQKLEFLSKAIELNKSNIDLYLYRAKVFNELKEFDTSLQDINFVLKKSENNIDAIRLKVSILTKLKKFEDALKIADLYLETKEYDVDLLIQKIIIFSTQEKYKLAEDICSTIIENNPEYSGGYSARGNTRRLMKKFDTALEDIYKALELDSDNIQAVGTLAEIYAEIGKANEFYIHFENAVRMDPNFMYDAINDEEIYNRYKDEERFIMILQKYDIYLEKI